MDYKQREFLVRFTCVSIIAFIVFMVLWLFLILLSPHATCQLHQNKCIIQIDAHGNLTYHNGR